MGKFYSNLQQALKDFYERYFVTKPVNTNLDKYGNPLPSLPKEQLKLKFREFLTSKIAEGWSIEIENEFDVVLSKKPSFTWFGKLVIFLLLLLIFAPLALFYLIVVIVKGVTSKPIRRHFRIDEHGRIHQK